MEDYDPIVWRKGMWLSTRTIFRHGDAGWQEYMAFIELPRLHEVRSLDSSLNDVVEGLYHVRSLDEIRALLPALQPPAPHHEYIQLVVNVQHEAVGHEIGGSELLGYDLSDETHTSSLLNCGPWTGALAPLAQRLNQYGLLSLTDARLAQQLLPAVWGADPHADVEIWALFALPHPTVPSIQSG